jgi:hypothetical protein
MRKHLHVGWQALLLSAALPLLSACNTPGGQPPGYALPAPPPTPTPYWRGPQQIAAGGARSPAVGSGGWVVWEQDSGVGRGMTSQIRARQFDGSAWLPPQTLSRGNHARAPQICGAGSFWSLAVWEEEAGGGFPVVRASFYNGSTHLWSTPLTVSDGQSAATQSAPAALFDGPRAVWSQSVGSSFGIWSARLSSPASGWEAPQALGSTNVGPMGPPQIAARTDVVVVWAQPVGHSSSTTLDSRIFANRFNSGTARWGGAQLIQASQDRAVSPAVDVDAAGNATAVWSEHLINADIWASRFDNVGGTGWGPPQRLSDTATDVADDPRVVIVGGEAVVVWSVRGWWIEGSHSVGSGWAGRRQLSANTVRTTGSPDLAAFQSVALAIWPEGANGIRVARYEPGAGFGASERIGDGLFAANPRIHAASAGLFQAPFALAVWEEGGPDGTPPSIVANTYR